MEIVFLNFEVLEIHSGDFLGIWGQNPSSLTFLLPVRNQVWEISKIKLALKEGIESFSLGLFNIYRAH